MFAIFLGAEWRSWMWVEEGYQDLSTTKPKHTQYSIVIVMDDMIFVIFIVADLLG